MMLDKAALTHQQMYIQDAEYINQKIPGKNYADRLHTLVEYHREIHGKSYDQLITEDIEKIVTNKLKNLGVI